jgi:glyoxylase-like metal-dependent hydrolase (beta-lactamase superfamily II)/rhodanese-related sulfurtransferase
MPREEAGNMDMIFHQVGTERGCQSYLIGCKKSCAAIVVDPELTQLERYQALAAQEGLVLHYTLDTHTHADHFSATHEMGKRFKLPVIMHRTSPAPFADMRVDDGEIIIVGELRLKIMYTPGHTADSMCVLLNDRILTGDTLLIGGTGRTDLPTGDPEQLYDSLFNGVLKLDPETLVYPGHIYINRTHSTLEEELANNKRLQKKERNEFVDHMRHLDLRMPDHLTEAIRTNMSGGKTIAQMLGEAAGKVSFMSMEEVSNRIQGENPDVTLLDVRERDAYVESHIPGAVFLPRGQLELRVNDVLSDPTQRIVVYCEFGKISTLAAATLKDLGFGRAVALDGGITAWKEQGYEVEAGSD